MKLKTTIIMGSLLLSVTSLGDVNVNTATSSTTLAELQERSAQKSEKFFYLVDNFSELSALPGFSFGAPSGLTGGFGSAFISAAGNYRTRDKNVDGSAAIGMGFGDPNKYFGGSAALALGSVNPLDGGAFNRGSLDLSIGRNIQKYGLGVSVGASNIDLWHADSNDQFDPSFYAAITKLFPNNIAPVIVTGGIGNNAYAYIDREDPKDKWNEFFSAAAYVHPQLSIVGDYTSKITTFGISAVPMPSWPITLGLAAHDVFKVDEEIDSVSILGTVAIGFTF